jgi:hypothetical protein
VLGKISIQGVTHGEMKMYIDGTDVVYEWTGEEDDEL